MLRLLYEPRQYFPAQLNHAFHSRFMRGSSTDVNVIISLGEWRKQNKKYLLYVPELCSIYGGLIQTIRKALDDLWFGSERLGAACTKDDVTFVCCRVERNLKIDPRKESKKKGMYGSFFRLNQYKVGEYIDLLKNTDVHCFKIPLFVY